MKDKIKNKIKNHCIYWIIISTVLSLVSFVSVVFIICYISRFYINTLCCISDNIIISSFGIIVTLLVGWNIYKGIDIDKRIKDEIKSQNKSIRETDIKTKELINEYNKKIEDIEDNFDKEIREIKEHNEEILNKLLSNSCQFTARIYRDSKINNNNDLKLAFYYYQQAIIYCSKIHDFDTVFANRLLSEMRMMLKDPQVQRDNNNNIIEQNIKPFIMKININEYIVFTQAINIFESKQDIEKDYLEIIKKFSEEVFKLSIKNNSTSNQSS